MQSDPYEPQGTLELSVGNLFTLHLQTPPDIDALLDRCIATAPSDTDAIPYYAYLWPSAKALVAHLATQKVAIKGRKVLELGCGIGAPAIAASKLGAEVVATDFHPDVQAWFERNASLNQVEIPYHLFDWNSAYDPALNALAPDHTFDLILGSDLLYERRHIPALIQTLQRFLSPKGYVLIADPGRDNLQLFLTALETANWQCELQTLDEIWLLRCRPPQKEIP